MFLSAFYQCQLFTQLFPHLYLCARTHTDNIIMWRETDANGGLGLDYALSFQESAGCTAIWYACCVFTQRFMICFKL